MCLREDTTWGLNGKQGTVVHSACLVSICNYVLRSVEMEIIEFRRCGEASRDVAMELPFVLFRSISC
jgi:hypothetical protein